MQKQEDFWDELKKAPTLKNHAQDVTIPVFPDYYLLHHVLDFQPESKHNGPTNKNITFLQQKQPSGSFSHPPAESVKDLSLFWCPVFPRSKH